MLNYTTKKRNKLNTYKIVRENIRLNTNNVIEIDARVNFANENDWMLQLAEMNLTNHLQNQKLSKKGQLLVKWWEN